MCEVTRRGRSRSHFESRGNMAALLNRWVNDEVRLSRRVLSFESDFASGYLLGELLHLFNQQKNFSSFQDSSTSDAKVANFLLLEPTLCGMGIRFNAVIAQGKPFAVCLLMCKHETNLGYASKCNFEITTKQTCILLLFTMPIASSAMTTAALHSKNCAFVGIMNAKQGVASALLYEIKMAIKQIRCYKKWIV